MTDEEKRFDRREEARLDDMYDAQCERCGEVNPAEIHTCTPKQEPEPVAWMYEYGTDHGDAVNQIFWHKNLRLEKPTGLVRNVVPLYTAPPQQEGCAECGKQASDGWALYCVKCIEPVRKWQPLTDEELAPIYAEYKSPRNIYLSIESALRSKNTCG